MPEESERQALIDQQDNPLVAKVASELQQRIDAQDNQELAGRALVELHRLIHRIQDN